MKIFIVDGYNLIYRLFYAVPPFYNNDGLPVNAVFGIAKSLLSVYKQHKPDKLIFTLDSPGETFREKIFSEYKGTRDRMPTDLRAQESMIFDMLSKMNIKTVAMSGYEADDIIGTLALKLKENKENNIFIMSGDKDLFQFIDENVFIYDGMKNKIYTKEESLEKFGVDNIYVADYLAIVGDSSDNIPGIKGFGPKKAQDLINKFGTIENIYNNLESLGEKDKLTLEANRELAFLSKELATIETKLDLDLNLDNYNIDEDNILNPETISFFKELNFNSLIPEEHKQQSNFDSLGLKINKLTTKKELDNLINNIKKQEFIGFSTFGELFNLEGINIYFGDVVYSIGVDNTGIIDFLEELLKLELTIVSYDAKADLKQIISFIDGNMSQNTSSSKSQQTLF